MTHNLTEYGPSYNPSYINIPEFPWATFWTMEYELRDYWRLKLFPDNIFFFVFLLLVPLVALLLRSVHPLWTMLQRGVWVPVPRIWLQTKKNKTKNKKKTNKQTTKSSIII